MRMWRKEGFYGFFKGNWSNVVKIAPQTALEFYLYEFYKQQLLEENEQSKLKKMLCGNLTGASVGMLIHPLELVRTHLSVSVKNFDAAGTTKPTIQSTMSDLYWKGGIPGLYRGLCSSLMAITPFIGVKMATFDILKAHFMLDKSHPYFVWLNMGLGSFAGVVSVTIGYPLDTIRRRMMMRGTKGYTNYNSTYECILKVHRTEGLTGFYKGYVPSTVKMVPAQAIIFLTNDLLKQFMAL